MPVLDVSLETNTTLEFWVAHYSAIHSSSIVKFLGSNLALGQVIISKPPADCLESERVPWPRCGIAVEPGPLQSVS